MITSELWIGGKAVSPTGGEYFEDKNPSTMETIAKVAKGNTEDVESAVKAAKSAFEEYKNAEIKAKNHPIFCDSICNTQGVNAKKNLNTPPIKREIKPICIPDIANKWLTPSFCNICQSSELNSDLTPRPKAKINLSKHKLYDLIFSCNKPRQLLGIKLLFER